MSRTTRRKRKSDRPVRDGALQYSNTGCRHRGPCGWCESDRTHASKRRAPVDEPMPWCEQCQGYHHDTAEHIADVAPQLGDEFFDNAVLTRAGESVISTVAPKHEPNEWIVKARTTTLREYVIRGTREEAETLAGFHLDERELDLVDFEVQSVEPNT